MSSREEIVQRFVISDSPLNLTGSGVSEYHCRHWGTVFITQIHASRAVHLDLASRQDLKDAFNLLMLPPTTAAASDLPTRMLTILANHGIVPTATDKVVNVLRALRNLKENSFGFDISD
jgi:hypothetical protein